MEIKTKEFKRVTRVSIFERIDSEIGARVLEETLASITLYNSFKIVVNMEGVRYLSSRGIRALINAKKECRRWNRGDLVLCNVPVDIKEAFLLFGVTSLFKVYESETEAVGSF